MVPATLGHYHIVRSIGAGGMGEVFLADDTRLGRSVALKVLSRALAGDPERRGRFEREARAVAALNHPNIITIHSVEEQDGLLFLTMELVEGKTLSELITPHGLPVELNMLNVFNQAIGVSKYSFENDQGVQVVIDQADYYSGRADVGAAFDQQHLPRDPRFLQYEFFQDPIKARGVRFSF